jgi:hypothetical protein
MEQPDKGRMIAIKKVTVRPREISAGGIFNVKKLTF